eukprot:COSAG02_NODE_2465_length_8785_cov_21.743610_3_plen_352_part_00
MESLNVGELDTDSDDDEPEPEPELTAKERERRALAQGSDSIVMIPKWRAKALNAPVFDAYQYIRQSETASERDGVKFDDFDTKFPRMRGDIEAAMPLDKQLAALREYHDYLKSLKRQLEQTDANDSDAARIATVGAERDWATSQIQAVTIEQRQEEQAGHPHGSDRTHVTTAGIIDISHAMPAAGTSAEQGKYRRFDYPLIETASAQHWPAGKELTFNLKHRSVEIAGQYGFALTSLDNTSFDNTCRVCIVLETDTPSHQPTNGPSSQVVPLYSGDNGDSTDPTLSWNDLDGPVELGGTDVHTGAYLFAHTAGDNTGIQRLHLGPYTCAAGKELALVRVLNATGSPNVMSL